MIATVLFIIGWVAFIIALVLNYYGFLVRSLNIDWQTWADMAAVVGVGMYVEAAIFAVAS